MSPTRTPAAPGPASTTAGAPPLVVARGTALGLVLMAVFTTMWASNTYAGWPVPAAVAVSAAGDVAAVVFVVRAVQLLRAGSRFRAQLSEADEERRRRTDRAFGALFAAEGVAIGIAVPVLAALGASAYVVPVIALVVGLHFFPMAGLFGRRIDTYLATWTSLVGLAGILALATTGVEAGLVQSWVGLGAALATGTYGISMLRLGGRLLQRAR